MVGKRAVLLYLVLALVAIFVATTLGCPLLTPEESRPGVLKLYDIDPLTLDPAISGEMTSHHYVVQIFSGLLRLDANMNPVPDIAKSWTLSPEDGRTYIFTLRQDARFHDGRQVKAADFKYSWERAVAPATGSQTASTYLGDIVGVDDVLAGRTTEISGVKVRDDFTLEVTIDAPRSYFLARMTYPTSFVVDRSNVEKGGEWWREPNGSGPFKLKTWELNTLLVLEADPDNYRGPPKLTEVEHHLWRGVPMDLYELGEIDAAGVGISYIDRITDPAGPFATQLQTSPELSLGYIGFDVSRPPFDDVNVRRAFTYAIDKAKLASLVFRDMMQPAPGIIPPGMPGYNEKLAGIGFDPAKAKELLKASRYGDASKLPPITITTSGWGGAVSHDLEAVIQEWRQHLGVEVKVRQLEPELFLYNLKEEKDEMFSMGWVADYAHPENFLNLLFRTGAQNNSGLYSDPEVDRLLEQGGRELDPVKSRALYQQAEQKIVDDAAVIPLWFGKNYTLVRPYVKGFSLNALGYVELNNVTVER